MLDSIQGLGKSGYGVLYMVPGAYMYLIANESPEQIPLIGFSISNSFLFALLLLSIYSAMWMHRAGLLIYGNENGMNTVKSSVVSNKHLVSLIWGTEPDDLIDSESLLALSFNASQQGYSLRKLARSLPASLLGLYALIGWVLLSTLFFEGGGSMISGLFWLVLTVLLFRGWVIGYLPAYIPPESADSIDEAAYVNTYREIRASQGESDTHRRIKKGENRQGDQRIR